MESSRFYTIDDGTAFHTMYALFIAEKYPHGQPSLKAKTREEFRTKCTAEFAEFEQWEKTNPIGIRLAKLDKMELREAGWGGALDE